MYIYIIFQHYGSLIHTACMNCVQYDLELVFVRNNHVFVEEYMKKPDFVELMRRLGALGDGNQDQSKFHQLQFN